MASIDHSVKQFKQTSEKNGQKVWFSLWCGTEWFLWVKLSLCISEFLQVDLSINRFQTESLHDNSPFKSFFFPSKPVKTTKTRNVPSSGRSFKNMSAERKSIEFSVRRLSECVYTVRRESGGRTTLVTNSDNWLIWWMSQNGSAQMKAIMVGKDQNYEVIVTNRYVKYFRSYMLSSLRRA